jgi:hypothetical protein
VTSPVEEKPSSSVLSRRYSGSTDGGLEDAEFPVTPTTPGLAFPSSLRSPSASGPGISKSRKVGFSSPSKKTIFRYFPPYDPLESAWPDSDSDAGSEGSSSGSVRSTDGTTPPRFEEDADEDSQWWWDGWEESHECEEKEDAEDEESDAADREAEEDARWLVEIGREFEETHSRSLSGRVFVVA